MGNDVFANGREISCKAADGKSICAFPDVCFTPPENPTTPPGVPIPYPNTGMAKDMTSGTKKVKISKKEVIKKNKSYFKKSIGDEAGSAAKKGVITSTNRGKVYFNSWSMDVKFEGKNVVRHLDLTTHNHASMPGDTPTWPYIDSMALSKAGKEDPCKDDKKAEKDACKDFSPHKKEGPSPCPPKPSDIRQKAGADAFADTTAKDKCLQARRCQMVPYKPTSKQASCCPGQTGHHLVEAASFFNVGRGGKKSKAVKDTSGYNEGKAPCICVEGMNQYHGTHGLMHTFQSTAAQNATTVATSTLKLTDETEMPMETKQTTYGEAKKQGIEAAKKTFPESVCDQKCMEAQLDAYHNEHGIENDTQCKQVITGYSGDAAAKAAADAVIKRSSEVQKAISNGSYGVRR
jgi:hypothetical protein